MSRLSLKTLILFAAVLLMWVLWYFAILPNDLWVDEIFTGNLVNNDMLTLLRLSADDFHPPLYAIMSRLFTYVFGYSTLALRTFSFLSYIGLLVLGMCSLRKIIGDGESLFFIFLITFSPVMCVYVLEIRMYMWACLFVTIFTVYAYQAVFSHKPRYVVIMCASGIAAAYTHYYALVTVAIVYGIVLLYSISKKLYPKIKILILCIAISIMSYLPWIIALMLQIKAFATTTYIAHINLYEFIVLPAYFFYVGTNRSHNFSFNYIWLSLPIVLCVAAIMLKGFWQLVADRLKFSLQALSIYACVATTLFFVLFSIFVKPLFNFRYFMCLFGLLCIFLSCSLSCFKSKQLIVVIVAVFVSSSMYKLRVEDNMYGDAPIANLFASMSASAQLAGTDLWVVCDPKGSAKGYVNYYIPDAIILDELPDSSTDNLSDQGWLVHFFKYSNEIKDITWHNMEHYSVLEETTFYFEVGHTQCYAARVSR